MPRLWPDPRDPPPSPDRRLLHAAEAVIVAILLAAAILSAATGAFAEVPIVPAGRTFTCTPVRIWDGDGPIWCREGPHVRLARINTRELDGTCRRGAPCPRATGADARDHLARLLGGSRGRTRSGHILVAGPRLACRSDGSAKGNRTAAWCRGPAGDLSTAMIRAGFAAPWRMTRRH